MKSCSKVFFLYFVSAPPDLAAFPQPTPRQNSLHRSSLSSSVITSKRAHFKKLKIEGSLFLTQTFSILYEDNF